MGTVGPADTATVMLAVPENTPPPAGTLTAEAALTVIPVPTGVPGLQATHVARATVSPFPTSEVDDVQAGSPGSPLVAAARRAGLSLEMRLLGDEYLAGENGRAEITLRNDSSATLFAGNIQFTVQDEAGRFVDPWPLMPGPRAGWPGQERFEWYLRPLQPGQSITETVTFQIPSVEVSRGHTYTAHASAQLARADIQHPDRSDNVPADVQTKPVPLRVVAPVAQQHLKAEWQGNRQGYTLRVTDADGDPVGGPVWGAIDVRSDKGGMSGALQDSSEGMWSSGWAEFLTEGGAPLQVRAWVAARGYLPAIIEETVPGTNKQSPPPPIYTPVATVTAGQPALPAATVAP
ncbi:MAG: hypothetical protein M3441_10400 [Chloroflexota bacterium]|nr:hypothetical protein [Chloroflexota bacterium]